MDGTRDSAPVTAAAARPIVGTAVRAAGARHARTDGRVAGTAYAPPAPAEAGGGNAWPFRDCADSRIFAVNCCGRCEQRLTGRHDLFDFRPVFAALAFHQLKVLSVLPAHDGGLEARAGLDPAVPVAGARGGVEQPHYVEELREQIDFYNTRLTVRPGLTGWAQVSYGYGSGIDGARRKLAYDLYYVKHQSVSLDLLIVARTVLAVLRLGGR